jgi:hypothetical protein
MKRLFLKPNDKRKVFFNYKIIYIELESSNIDSNSKQNIDDSADNDLTLKSFLDHKSTSGTYSKL